MPTTIRTVTIPAGESLSNGADISGAVQIFVGTPAVWTSANVTFQVSLDSGATWFDWFGGNNQEEMMAMGGLLGGMRVLTSDTVIPKTAQIKLRSGNRRNPIVQQQDAVFTLYVIT